MGLFLHSLEASKIYPKLLLREQSVAQPHDAGFASGLTRHGSMSCAEQEGQDE